MLGSDVIIGRLESEHREIMLTWHWTGIPLYPYHSLTDMIYGCRRYRIDEDRNNHHHREQRGAGHGKHSRDLAGSGSRQRL